MACALLPKQSFKRKCVTEWKFGNEMEVSGAWVDVGFGEILCFAARKQPLVVLVAWRFLETTGKGAGPTLGMVVG